MTRAAQTRVRTNKKDVILVAVARKLSSDSHIPERGA